MQPTRAGTDAMTDPARYAVNEYAPDPSVVFDRKIGETYVRSAHMLAARGYVQSTLGGMVIRVEHPKHPDGIAYAKPAGDHLRVRGEAPDPRRAPRTRCGGCSSTATTSSIRRSSGRTRHGRAGERLVGFARDERVSARRPEAAERRRRPGLVAERADAHARQRPRLTGGDGDRVERDREVLQQQAGREPHRCLRVPEG